MRIRWPLLALTWLLPAACDDATDPAGSDTDAGAADARPAAEAGSDAAGAVVDAGPPDGGADAGVVDASSDSAADSGSDSGSDSGADSGSDSGADSGSDSGSDAGWSFTETFPGGAASAWPARWTILGGTASASVTASGGGRLVPTASSYSLARVGTTEGVRDVDVTFKLRFEDANTQGVGFYVRQNGGYLKVSAVHGQGYAVFVERFRGSRIGVWREVDGAEIEITPSFTAFASDIVSNVTYSVRFVVKQEDPTTTRLRARMWVATDAEPATWQVDHTDTTAALQNISGGMATDSWSTATAGTITAGTVVDDIVAVPAP
ncbi:MAG: hypothetical protein U0270_41930 [Labilithrix sp.]